MALYLISYDVTKNDDDYDDDYDTSIYDKIDKIIVQHINNNAKAVLQSQRIVRSNENAQSIRDAILAELEKDEKDRIELIVTPEANRSSVHPRNLIKDAPYVRDIL